MCAGVATCGIRSTSACAGSRQFAGDHLLTFAEKGAFMAATTVSSGYSAWEALRDPSASPLPDPLAALRIADEHLERVLRGFDLLVEDGAIGTQLQAHGVAAGGQIPDLASIEHPDVVTLIHREYVEAGAQMVTTNSFGANALKLGGAASVEDVCSAAVACAKRSGARYVAGSIGPLGKLLEPFGDVSFDDAYDLFHQQAEALAQAGADLIAIETMTDLREAKAALLAARDACDLPVIASMTYAKNRRTMFGSSPAVVAATLSALGANVVCVNCSLGPEELLPVVEELVSAARCPVAVRPNAGMPRLVDGETVYDVTPEQFASAMEGILDAGATLIGGCCGTNPSFTRLLSQLAQRRQTPVERVWAPALRICGSQSMAQADLANGDEIEIVSAVDPSDEDLLDDVREGDADSIVDEVMDLRGDADVFELDLSAAGISAEDERELLVEVVSELEETSPVPLCIRVDDPETLEAVVRPIAGKPLVGPTQGGIAAFEALLPVAKRYGCAVAVPQEGERALEAADCAMALGIPGEDIVLAL